MLQTGTHLGPYEILAPLGAGGMGEVYRARDTRLGREVAVKILPPHFAGDPDRRQRFEREARAVAALSHPNILALHDVGTQAEVTFLVLELLEGQTLRERLRDGPLPWRKAVELGVGIADGLSAAHAKGVIHRDLKPENLFVTIDGRVKILDFGLARVGEEASPLAETGPYSPSPTKTGAVMGTIGYMSPEQVRGQPLDARSDIFSLGCVLHEMISGRPPFARETSADTQTAILREEPPPLSPSGAEYLPELDHVIRHCLEKNREERFQTARDLGFALKAVLAGSASLRALPARPAAGLASIAWLAAVALALVVFVGGVYFGFIRREKPPVGAMPIQSLAVIPFTCGGDDPKSEHLGAGMSISLTNHLGKVHTLTVRPFSSVSRFTNPRPDLKTLAHDLEVDAVVTGMVQKLGQDIIVSWELVDARTHRHIDGKQHTRPYAELLPVQEQIAREILAALSVPLSQDVTARIKPPTSDLKAHELYIRGRIAWERRTSEDLLRAIACFTEATKLDKNYAQAHAGLGDCYMLLPWYNRVPAHAYYEKAKAALETALSLDPNLAEAYASRAYIKLANDWDFDGAERDAKHAVELDPNYAVGHLRCGNVLEALRPAEAVAHLQQARRCAPDSLIINSELGAAYYLARDYDRAMAQFQATLRLRGGLEFPHTYAYMGSTYVQKNLYTEGIAALQKAVELDPSMCLSLPYLSHAYARAGNLEQARVVLKQLHQRAADGQYVAPLDFAIVHMALGDKPRALDELEKGLTERSDNMVCLNVDPVFDSLRNEPRFIALLQRIGLMRKATAPDSPLDTLAVLPFDNQSPDAEAGYLGDDITFSLTESLGRFRDLKVRSFSSASRFRDRSKSHVQAGRELQVPVVLTGTIQKRGDELVIFVELVDVQQDRPLWKQRYTGKFAERLTLQRDILKDMPDKLRLALTGEQKQALARLPTQSLKAHELYVQGRLAWSRRTVADMKNAIDFFEQAIQLDPDYAQAYAGMADCYVLSPSYAFASPKDASPKAREAALQALRRDATLGEAHIALAEIKFWFDWDFPGAETEFRRGLELKPTYATGRQWYGEFLSCMGRHDAAIAELRQAKQLDPEALIIRCDLARAYAFARRYDEAAAELRAALAKEPNFAMTRTFLGWVLADQGKLEEAIAELEAAYQLDPHHPLREGLLGYAYGSAGRSAEARRSLQRLRELSQQRDVSPAFVFLAQIHMSLGEKDLALTELEKGLRERSPAMVRLIDPTFGPLRAEPRFQALLKQMNFPP